jgi:hypothetical protein
MKLSRNLAAKSLRLGIAAALAMAAASACVAQSAVALPAGVKAVWDLSKAYHETTRTRERTCINGLWFWQPTTGAPETVPTAGWGYLKVPAPWPGHEDYDQHDCQSVISNPAWKDVKMGDVNAAWYQREINVPGNWAGRRITLFADCLNSYAAVYLDGKKAGELRFPGGELDLTAHCKPGTRQTLSLLVIAIPLHAVMFSHSDTFGSAQVQGNVSRRGLCGDVWLTGTPAGPCVSDVKVDTCVRKWQVTFEVGLEDLAADAQYRLKAVVSAEGLPDREFTSQPFAAADLKDGRFSFTSEWHAEKLWDINTPQNIYEVKLSLLGAGSEPLDEAMPERFGFREFWINGKDFYLNGSRIYLFGLPLDNAGLGAAWATYGEAKETMLRMKSFGTNFVYGHNYSCAPGVHLSYAGILRAADDAGMLLALPMPHFQDYDWNAADAAKNNGYAAHAGYYVRRVAMNHPSVIMYAMSHNAMGGFGDKDPDQMGIVADPYEKEKRSPNWPQSNEAHGMLAQSIVKNLDPARIVYHHSGEPGEVYTSNFYLNFTPVQEMDDWFGPFSEKGVKPIFLCECGTPISWDFSMYRGYNRGGRAFGSAAVPWELSVAQWNAQFTGDKAYQISDEDKTEMRWEAKQFLSGRGWHHWDYPIQLEDEDSIKPVIARYIAENTRAWRTWGVSAFNAWEYASFWHLRKGTDKGRTELRVDWENLQQPGFSPDYIAGRLSSMPTDFEPADWTPDAAGKALLRNNMPLLAYIGGKPESVTSKDHNFVPGETVIEQVVIINNSRVPATFECTWSSDLPGAQPGRAADTIQTGEQKRVPVQITLPADAAAGDYTLNATVKFGTGESQSDSFQIAVMPHPQSPAMNARIALFDPQGETAKLLDAIKIAYRSVDADGDLGGYDILIVGKGALTVDKPAPNIMRVQNGLRVIVFEQTSDALEKRLGFRTEEYGLRRVFKRVPDSRLLAGLENENLRDWRGAATLLPPRLDFKIFDSYSGMGQVEWCGFNVEHIFRCGCQGNVASVLIEKPARGDFMPIADGGWSLQFSPLMVYREGNGMVLFCQMDVTGRTESDPAAETLVGNIFRYVSNWKATPTDRKAIYAGDPAGEQHLEHSGIVPGALASAKLSPDEVLVVGTGAEKTLRGNAQAIGDFIKGGGRVLALGLDGQEARSLLPTVQMKDNEHISTFFKPFGEETLLAGIGPADVYDAGAEHPPLVTAGAQAFGDGILANAPGANLVFFQLPPYAVTKAEGAAQAFKVDTGDAVDGTTHSALVVMGTTGTAGVQLAGMISADPDVVMKQHEWEPDKVKWEPKVGRTYTFAVFVKGVGSPVTLHLEVERNGFPYDRVIHGPDVLIPEGKWTDLHQTFKVEKAYPQGWTAYVACSEEGVSFRADSFRLYEGEYAPWNPQGAAAGPTNLILNPSFEAGASRYWFGYSERYNARRTYRRASFVMTRLLADLGVACPTPLLSRFGSPLTDKAEERWTDGLYVDQVEAWDDPYKSFNW